MTCKRVHLTTKQKSLLAICCREASTWIAFESIDVSLFISRFSQRALVTFSVFLVDKAILWTWHVYICWHRYLPPFSPITTPGPISRAVVPSKQLHIVYSLSAPTLRKENNGLSQVKTIMEEKSGLLLSGHSSYVFSCSRHKNLD